MRKTMMLVAGALALAGCGKAGPTQSTVETKTVSNDKAGGPIASAESAAPASIAKAATIMEAATDGSMKTLRSGTNGWTCIPDDPNTPATDPMCMDSNALQWAGAMMAHKTPPAGVVGVMYMLKGGSDASNTDPFVTKPAAGKDWVKTGPHIMVVGSDALNKLYPGGDNPDTSKPYTMYGGTPYAHVMVPVS